MKHARGLWTVVVVFLMVLSVAVPAAAQAKTTSGNTPSPRIWSSPAWTARWGRGLEADVDIYTLSNLQAGFLGYFEARKGNWGFGADVVYMALGESTDRVNIDPSQAAFLFLATRRLTPTLDLQFGARWNVVRGRIEFKDNSVVLAGTVVEETKQWVDPVVGLRWKQPLGERWLVSVPVNVGGFGVSSSIAVDVFPTLQYKLGRHAWIGGGWRFLYMDYETGYEDGVPIPGEDAFRYDMITSGPVMGVAFRF